MTLKP